MSLEVLLHKANAAIASKGSKSERHKMTVRPLSMRVLGSRSYNQLFVRIEITVALKPDAENKVKKLMPRVARSRKHSRMVRAVTCCQGGLTFSKILTTHESCGLGCASEYSKRNPTK